jgi:adenine-specific DNA-methyltransferase
MMLMNNLRKNINELYSKYDIDEIEISIIKAYLKNHNISNIKNDFILNHIQKENYELTEKIITMFKILDLKTVEQLFELLIKPEDKKINGIHYTPEFIVKYIINNTINGDVTVCDPSCGSGAFLSESVKKIHKDTNKSMIQIIENNIYGCDILSYSVRRTKIILYLLAVTNGEDKKHIKFNLCNDNSLTMNWINRFPKILKSNNWKDLFEISERGFDVIVGNPPYVRIQDFGEETKKILIKKWNTTNIGNFNLYFPFFELGLKLLNKGGKLTYITPNNYFTSLAAKSLRSYLQKNKLISKILDFNHLKIFENTGTYTCITFLDKIKNDTFKYQSINEKSNLDDLNDIKYYTINVNNLKNKKWRLLNEIDYKNISNIENIGTKLKTMYNIHVGVATLRDNLYFMKDPEIQNEYYIKILDGKKFLIEKDITRVIRKIPSIKNEEDMKNDKRLIIFPYIMVNKKVKIIPENIIEKKYPECYKYFCYIKDKLNERDKGMKKYSEWYAYGRGQGLNMIGKKLLTPTFSNKPKFIFDEDENSLFCNGYAIFGNIEKIKLNILQKILNSVVMDYFIKKTSVNIEGNYQCYQKNFIESFSIPEFSIKELEFLENENNSELIDNFLIKKYNLNEKPIRCIMKY